VCTFFFSHKVDDLFLVVSKRQYSVVKKLAVDPGPLAAGDPSHATTGTMDNPALSAARTFSIKSAVAIPHSVSLKSTKVNKRSPIDIILNISIWPAQIPVSLAVILEVAQS